MTSIVALGFMMEWADEIREHSSVMLLRMRYVDNNLKT